MSFKAFRRLPLASVVVTTAALLAACGGGSQVTAFAPTRVLAFGDETSVIEDANNNGNGRKYTVNALAADNVTLNCAGNPIWVQYLATQYGLTFPQCNPGAVAAPASRIRAAAGAKVADVKAQIDAQLAADGFNGLDLVTILAGSNDILAQYAQYPGVPEATLVATLEQAGIDLAAQVNRVALAGGKVLIATVPDLGLTPFAVTESADPAKDSGRAALLTRLTARLNAKLRLNIINDGRKIGLLLADETFQTLVKFPTGYGLVNFTQPACTSAAVRDCTTLTLQPAVGSAAAATAASWLWASPLQPGATGHSQLGQLAASRARGNPF